MDKIEIFQNDPSAGSASDFTLAYPDEYRGDSRTLDAALGLRSETGG